MRIIFAVILLVCVPLMARADWELVAEDDFNSGPTLPWVSEVLGTGSVTFGNGVMAMSNSTTWSGNPLQYGTLVQLAQSLPDEYRVTYRFRNLAICGWMYTRVLDGPFFDLANTNGYSATVEFCGPAMFIASLPATGIDDWQGDRISEWYDSHLDASPYLWRTAELIRRDGVLSFYVEGETTLLAPEPDNLTSGRLHFYVHDGSIRAELDDIKVYAWRSPSTPTLPITLGTSWDNISLQQILDEEYGPGAIDVETDYEGYLAGDGDPAWWQDFGVNSILVREIAGFEHANTMGWHADDRAGPPVIDGIDDGIIFDGPVVAGSEVLIEFPASERFGFYLNPNGPMDATNAPEPELFFANRQYNDIGPDGSGASHAPFDGDMQCLIYNITHLRGGVPTYVLAWEDLDSGSEVTEAFWECGTDNDYNDLVVEISAFSPVKTEPASWGEIKARYEE